MNICAKCKHVERGRPIDLRTWDKHSPPPPPRPSLEGGDYICAREGLDAPHVDPVTGHKDSIRGPDCRDLNSNGECPHYEARPWLLSLSPLGLAFLVTGVWLAVSIPVVVFFGGN